MRSLFAKIFVCTLAIYPVTRGLGFLLLYLLGAPPVPPLPPRPEVLAQVLPLYAEVALATLEHGGDAALARFVDGEQKETGLRLRFAPTPAAGCVGISPRQPLVPGRAIAVPVASGPGAGYCLTAVRPLPSTRELALQPVLLLPMELACCALVSFLLARYLARPLRVLQAAAAAFAEGDLSARAEGVAPRRRDEAAELVRAFNHMAGRIAALIQAQQRFIADVSHEMKSPLARISLAAGLARRIAGPPADTQFDRLEREVETASDLVRELQALSSLGGATALARREPVDLVRLLAAAIDNVAFEWADRPHDIRLASPAEPVVTLGDPALLQRAAENVLRNALFYAPAGTAVEVAVGQRDERVRIEVRDHGPGAPAEALPHLFDPFYRVDESRGRNTGGSGIGLGIVARAVALHGGRANAANSEPSGLVVLVELAAAPPEAARRLLAEFAVS